MSITIGTQLGSFEITSLLGKGGMGEVYRARDTKLKREVAIKILPEEFSCDADRLSRFQREAEVLASLNHPNIATIYDLQEANETRFLVLELVEGETLAEYIQRGVTPDHKLMAVSLKLAPDSVEPSAPRELFALSILEATLSPFEAAPDGQRFLVRATQQASQPLTVIVNWPALLKNGATAP